MRSKGPFDWIQPRLHAMLPLATICNNLRWRAVARNKGVLSLQEENVFFGDVFPHEDHPVKEITYSRRCIQKMREKPAKSREKMIHTLVRK